LKFETLFSSILSEDSKEMKKTFNNEITLLKQVYHFYSYCIVDRMFERSISGVIMLVEPI